MPSGDTAKEDVSPEERIAIAEAKAARRTMEIIWLVVIAAILIFVIWVCASLKTYGG
jgi:t-SNARE complex subunit (syntaxin)